MRSFEWDHQQLTSPATYVDHFVNLRQSFRPCFPTCWSHFHPPGSLTALVSVSYPCCDWMRHNPCRSNDTSRHVTSCSAAIGRVVTSLRHRPSGGFDTDLSKEYVIFHFTNLIKCEFQCYIQNTSLRFIQATYDI